MSDDDRAGTGSLGPLRTLLAEGDARVRTLLAWLLSEDPRIELAGSVGSGEEAAAWTERLDAALVDVALPGLDALEAVRALRERHPGITVMVLANVDVPYLRAAAADAGAAAYVNRTTGAPLLADLLMELHTNPNPSS